MNRILKCSQIPKSTSGPSVSKPPCPLNDEHLCKCLEKFNKESVFDDSTKQPLSGSKSCRMTSKEEIKKR